MKQIAIAIDQLLNTLLGGMADETLSARAYRKSRDSHWWRIVRTVIDWVFFWQMNHCFAAYQSEIKRQQLPPEYRTILDADNEK